MVDNKHKEDIQASVQKYYGEIALRTLNGKSVGSCCSPSQGSCCGSGETILIDTGKDLYQKGSLSALPSDVTDISLGCGDPITLALLTEGQTVLDLGSGGGIDCFLASKKVGSSGHVIGVDMTPAMIDRAQANKAKLGVENVEFRLGEIENLPVANNTVDVIISNCVINLSPDKALVFREAFRVLKPGGKLAISDIAIDGELPDEFKDDISAWSACIAGAVDVKIMIAMIREAGFVNVEVRGVNPAHDKQDTTTNTQESNQSYVIKKQLNVSELGSDPSMDRDVLEEPIFDPEKSILSVKITALKPKIIK